MAFDCNLPKQTKQWKRSSLKRPDMGGQIEGINALGWETVLGDCMHEVQLRTLRSFGVVPCCSLAVVYYQELWAGNWMLGGAFLWCMLSLQDGNGSKPITMNFSGMNIYLPAILRFTRYQSFDPWPDVATAKQYKYVKYVYIIYMYVNSHGPAKQPDLAMPSE